MFGNQILNLFSCGTRSISLSSDCHQIPAQGKQTRGWEGRGRDRILVTEGHPPFSSVIFSTISRH